MPPLLPSRKFITFDQILYFAATFLLLFPAFYNGYPIINPDSGAYIATGWQLHVPIDRPITYSIFIRITSLSGLSLWGVVIAQTLILVYFLKRVSQKLLGEKYSAQLFLAIVLSLSAFTSVSWFCSLITPDIFTAILFLAIADVYLNPLSKGKKIASFFLIWFFIEQHNSHLLITLILCVSIILYCVLRKRKKWLFRKTLFLFSITIFSFISISFFNLWEGNSFRPSASTHVFIMARMAENGILDQFLKEQCPVENYSLCNYQNNTGDRQWEFMWSEKGHLLDAGGWDKTEQEYNRIIFKTLTTPKYLILQVYESLEATMRQVFQLQLSISKSQNKGSSPYSAIEEYLPREIKEYRTSLQQTNVIQSQTGYFNGLFFVFVILVSVLPLLLYNRTSRGNSFKNWKFFLALAVSGLLINAFVTATFSTIVDRLQSRVFWLLPFATLLFLAEHYYKDNNSHSPGVQNNNKV